MNRAYIIRCNHGVVDSIIPTANIPNPETFIIRFSNCMKGEMFESMFEDILSQNSPPYNTVKFSYIRDFLSEISRCDATTFMYMIPENVWYFSPSLSQDTLQRF